MPNRPVCKSLRYRMCNCSSNVSNDEFYMILIELLLLESQQAFFDILRNCSDYTETPLFVTRRKSSIYLCVIGISKRVCIISQCKEKEMQNNETDSKGPHKIQSSFQYIFEHFKGKLLLFILY